MSDVHGLLASALLAYLMLLSASLIRARAWTPPGLWVAMGNRDDVPPATALSGRADRAAINMLENLALFVAVVAAARFAGAPADPTGVAIFVGARVAYWPVYLLGIRGLRTLTWGVGVAGMAVIGVGAM